MADSEFDLSTLSGLEFVNRKRTRALELREAICEPPRMLRTIDGASSLEITFADPDRKVLESPALAERSWATVGTGKAAVHFELVGFEKDGERFKLIFEDAIVAELRRRTKPKAFPANRFNRAHIVRYLAKEARVPCLVDPRKTKVHNALHRSGDGEKTNTWDFLASQIAEPVSWRRFSDGHRLIVGSDDWLFNRDQHVTQIRENTGPFGYINFELDVAARSNEATVEVDVAQWALPPGSAVAIAGLGPANGKWIVAEIEHLLTSTRAEVTLVRREHALPEPKREGKGDPGEGENFIPGRDGTASGAGTAASPAREKMVRYALAQQGKAYVWGASGPNAFDCSGLVQQATAAAGHILRKPSDSQWSAIVAAGKTMSVSQAIATRGAILHLDGHIAISLGNGSTIEAMSPAYGVRVGTANGRGWTGGGWWI